MGAGVGVRRLFHCPTMPTIHTRCATFWQSVGEVVYTLTECPFALCLGYRAKVLALGKDCLLKFLGFIICPPYFIRCEIRSRPYTKSPYRKGQRHILRSQSISVQNRVIHSPFLQFPPQNPLCLHNCPYKRIGKPLQGCMRLG